MNARLLPRLGKLRVLVTQRCNLSCLYCHKEGQFSKRSEIKPEEFKGLTKIASEFGLDEVKYSGGEPLLYDGLGRLISGAQEAGITHTSVTTNGIFLEERLDELKESGLYELSISFDTLKPETFKTLNRGRLEDFRRVLRGIGKASKYDFPKMNLNMSLTRYNINETDDMLEFARSLKVQLRLISFIPLNESHKDAVSTDTKSLFEQLKKSAVRTVSNPDSPAYTSLTLEDGTNVCLVDSSCFSCDLCGKSYALRLTTDGKLKPCLISEKGEIDVITSYRQKNTDEVRHRFAQAVAIKKLGLMKFFDIPAKNLSAEYLTE